MNTNNHNTVVIVKNLRKHFKIGGGFSGIREKLIKAVDDVSFSIRRGETLGLVGESGCGKTTTGRCIIRLTKPTGGDVFFKNHNITHVGGSALRRMRRHFQIIFQDPYGSLNPRMNLEAILTEPFKIHKAGTRHERKEMVRELLSLVGLSSDQLHRYPHEFSGGQRQRIGIARAIALKPEFIVCDEPVSALDVSIQAQIINLLEDIQQKFTMGYLFIAHDLSVVKHISDRVAVMYLGRLVETGTTEQIFDSPLHPYTKALLSAIPVIDPKSKRRKIMLEGELPSVTSPPSGCPFHPRCNAATGKCKATIPNLRDFGNGHMAACMQV